jgi:DNA-binding NarL/FixJ family response regulator
MKTKIYIIEDNEMVSHLMTYTLQENFDCEILCAKSPENIHGELLSFQPHVVILDYNLRFDNIILSAESLLADINQLVPDTSTIIFSGQRNKDVAINLLKNGAVNYISKDSNDFHLEILEAVKELVTFQQSNKELASRLRNIKRNINWSVFILFFTVITSIIAISCG